jgi:hypothetical protein
VNNILNEQEILLCNNHLMMIEDALDTIRRKKESLRTKNEKLSERKAFLRKHFPFIAEKIIRLFIDNRKDKLDEMIWKLREPEREMQERAELYEKVIIFFQNENATIEKVHKVLAGLSQYLIGFSLKVSAELWEMKCNIDERNGKTVEPIDQATISFLRALSLIHA